MSLLDSLIERCRTCKGVDAAVHAMDYLISRQGGSRVTVVVAVVVLDVRLSRGGRTLEFSYTFPFGLKPDQAGSGLLCKTS